MKTIKFRTGKRHDWIDLTGQVKDYVKNSGVDQGLCLVYNPHSTGGLFVNSYLDPNTPEDIMDEIDRLVPTRFDFHHQFDTPTDAAGHVKSALVGIEAVFIIHDGDLILGRSQGIIFAEFDGPRNRKIHVKILPD